MIKLFIKLFLTLSLVCSFVLTSVAHAGLIKDVNYITYQGVDFAWASSVNSERWFIANYDYNTLLAPAPTQDGWDYADNEQLSLLTVLSNDVLLELFTSDNGLHIHAFNFWNDKFLAPDDTKDIKANQISSHWSWTVPSPDAITLEEKQAQRTEITGILGTTYDTFYVRTSTLQGNSGKPIPEPSTLMIFALGLIALAGKKKLFS